MKTLKIGDKLPNFECVNENEEIINSKQLIGKKLIVFFYPRANTPGCTAEACNLSENYKTLMDLGYNIIGISCDKPKSQKNFSDKYGFQYPLLADVDKKLVNMFGVWGPKKFMGKEYEGIHRMTFIFNEKGIVTRVIDKVKTKDHTNQILSE
ncbi:MAG: thioredoxin-dependent thiol peroxidase [Flavobacteriaceae bacterium]|nr:thioredoxin-dependent thiol peroxidase [Flavobacteriaceae bacterium]